MTNADPRRAEWMHELRLHEREIDRLCVEITMLDRERQEGCTTEVVREILRLQIEFANAQLTRHRIGAALIAARLRSPS